MTENGTAGMMVMTMTAVDYDDAEEGTNAKLKYSIEKNVIDEHTGTPIFEIEEETGVIKTAVCCLDREKTPDYSIQVVAMDGGGLKGTYILWNFHGKNIVIFLISRKKQTKIITIGFFILSVITRDRKFSLSLSIL